MILYTCRREKDSKEGKKMTGAIITVIVMIILIVLLCMGYVKAPPDMAFIISGIKKKSKVVIGKASIRIPFFERLDKLNLRLIPIDVKTSNAVPTADYININVDATVNIKISKLKLITSNPIAAKSGSAFSFTSSANFCRSETISSKRIRPTISRTLPSRTSRATPAMYSVFLFKKFSAASLNLSG